MKTPAASNKEAKAKVIAPETRKNIGRTTYVIKRHFTGRRTCKEAIYEAVINEAGRRAS